MLADQSIVIAVVWISGALRLGEEEEEVRSVI